MINVEYIAINDRMYPMVYNLRVKSFVESEDLVGTLGVIRTLHMLLQAGRMWCEREGLEHIDRVPDVDELLDTVSVDDMPYIHQQMLAVMRVKRSVEAEAPKT